MIKFEEFEIQEEQITFYQEPVLDVIDISSVLRRVVRERVFERKFSFMAFLGVETVKALENKSQVVYNLLGESDIKKEKIEVILNNEEYLFEGCYIKSVGYIRAAGEELFEVEAEISFDQYIKTNKNIEFDFGEGLDIDFFRGVKTKEVNYLEEAHKEIEEYLGRSFEERLKE